MDDDGLNQDANQATTDFDDVRQLISQYDTADEKAMETKLKNGEELKQKIHKLQQRLNRMNNSASERTQRTHRLIVEGATLEKALGTPDRDTIVGFLMASANQQRQLLTEYKNGTLNQSTPQHAQENTADDYQNWDSQATNTDDQDQNRY